MKDISFNMIPLSIKLFKNLEEEYQRNCVAYCLSNLSPDSSNENIISKVFTLLENCIEQNTTESADVRFTNKPQSLCVQICTLVFYRFVLLSFNTCKYSR